MESQNIARRIRKYLTIREVSEQQFAQDDKFGRPFDKGRIGKAVDKEDSSIGSDAVEKFLRMFPEVSPYWLILGEGPIDVNRRIMEGHSKLEDAYVLTLKDSVKSLQGNIDDLRGAVADLRGKVEDKEKIITLLENRS